MQIRPALPEDYAAAAALEQSVYALHQENRPDFFPRRDTAMTEERYRTMLENGTIFLLAEDEGRVVGQATAIRRGYKDHPVFRDIEWLEIDDISVDPSFQGRGAGKALFEAMTARARALGLHRVELTVWAFNRSARGFYEKMGMRSRIDRLELEL